MSQDPAPEQPTLEATAEPTPPPAAEAGEQAMPPGAEPMTEPAPEPPPPAPAQPTSTAVAPHRGHGITERRRGDFEAGQVELIRNTVAADCTPAELAMFLELCARYQLDPFAKQIWAAKIGGKVTIMVSRDGLLALADRHPDYRGYEGDVVHEHDDFKVIRRQGTIDVQHSYSGWKDRGEIVGAWCLVHRDGRKPTYFFAPFTEYRGQNVWQKNPSGMILKVAESHAHRKAFQVSGVVGEDEMAPTIDGTATDLTAKPAEPDFGEDPLLADHLRALFKALDYTPRKVMVKLAECWSHEDRVALAGVLEGECRRRGISLEPVEPEEVDGEAMPEPAVA